MTSPGATVEPAVGTVDDGVDVADVGGPVVAVVAGPVDAGPVDAGVGVDVDVDVVDGGRSAVSESPSEHAPATTRTATTATVLSRPSSTAPLYGWQSSMKPAAFRSVAGVGSSTISSSSVSPRTSADPKQRASSRLAPSSSASTAT